MTTTETLCALVRWLPTALPTYMTFWNLLFAFALHRFVHAHVDLVLMSTLVLTISTYTLCATPGHFRVALDWEGPRVVVVEGAPAIAFHVVIHLVPWLLVTAWYGSYYVRRGAGVHTLAAFLPFLAYLHRVQMEEVYVTPFEDAAAVGLATGLVYVVAICAVR